jgi:hypothetical protein
MSVWVKTELCEPLLERPVAILTECGSFDLAFMDSFGDFHGVLEQFYPGDVVVEWMDDGRVYTDEDVTRPLMMKMLELNSVLDEEG